MLWANLRKINAIKKKKSALSEDLVIVEKGKVSFFSDPFSRRQEPCIFQGQKNLRDCWMSFIFFKNEFRSPPKWEQEAQGALPHGGPGGLFTAGSSPC